MNDALLPYFTRRYEMTEAEAAAAERALAEDPALRQWLREQLEMEDLIARLLQPERADFANRVRSSLEHGRDTERFVARVQDLVTSQVGRARAPSQRVKKPSAALTFPRRLLAPWGLAACATVLVLVTAALVVSLRPGSRHQVLQGDIAVGNAAVHDIPDGRDFTVTGDAPAVVRLGVGAQAEFSPASTARITPATRTSSQVVQLGAGSGAFQLGQGDHELRVETALGSVTGSGADAAFTATFDATPGAPGSEGSAGRASDAPANGVLTVAVHTGSAHVEVHGKKQLILADEARVFSMVGGALTDERSFHGQLKSLTPSGPVANVTISDHSNKLITIALSLTTVVLINGVPATPGELKLGERIEVRTARDTPTIATLILLTKHHEAKKAEPVHPLLSVPAAPISPLDPMTLLRCSALLALLILLAGFSAPLCAGDAKVPTMTGLIDKLDSDNSRVILKTIDANPAKVKTMVVTIDKTSMITIDKVAGAYADLQVGDHVVVKYSQGVAITVVVSRAPATAAPAKP